MVVLGLDTRGMTAGAAQAQASMGKLSSGVQKGLGTAVPLASAAAGLAIGKFAIDSVQAAISFDKSFTRISAISNASAKDIEQWKGQVMDLAGETARAPAELADALFFLSSAGLETGQIMETLEMSAKAAASGLGSATDVAKITANALNAYADSGLTAAQVTDTLVAAVREGSAEPEEFAAALGRILPIASKAGVEFDQVTASLASLSNIGLDVNEGVTAMRGLMTSLFAPTQKSEMALKKMGLSADEVRTSLAEDGLIGTLRMLEEASGGNIETMSALVPNVRALTGVFGLTGQEAEKVDEIFRNVANSTGALGDAFATTADSDAFKLEQAMNNIKIAGQQVAADALPLITTSMGLLSEAIQESLGQLEPLTGLLGELEESADDTGFSWGNLVEAAQGLANPLEAIRHPIGRFQEAWGTALGQVEEGAEALDLSTAAARGQHVALEDLHGGLVQGVAAEEALAEVAEDVARSHRRAAAAALEQKNAILALAGGMLGIVSQANAVQEAQKEVNRLQAHGKQGTEAYRMANLQLLEAGLSLTEQIKSYAVELKESGASQKSVMRQVENLAADFGVQGSAARDLFGDVEDLIGAYGRVPATARTRLLADNRQAMAEIASLQEELAGLEHRAWIAHVQVVTEGGSTGFHLIEMLRGELDSLEDRDWRATIDVSVFSEGIRGTRRIMEHLADVKSAIGEAVGEGLSKSFLLEAKGLEAAGDDLITKLERKGDRLQRIFDRLQARAEEFGDSVRAAFDVDLLGGIAGLEELTAATASQFFADQLVQAQQFASALTQLQEQGLSQAGLEQLIGQGPDQGLEVAQLLLASPELLAQFNATQTALDNLGKTTENTLVDGVFGPSLEKAANHIERFTENAAGKLDAFADRVQTFVESFDRASLPKKFEDLGESLDRLLRLLDGDGRPSDGRHPPGASAPAGAMAVARSFDGDYRAGDRRIEVDIRTDWPAAIDQIDGELYKSDRRGGGLAHHRGT